MIPTHTTARTALWALALSLAPLTALSAQRPRRGAGPPAQQNRQELEQRVRARFAQMIQQRLGLDDETAQALNAAVQSFQEDRSQLAREQEALRKRVEAFALEGGHSDAEARQLLTRMDELRSQENDLYGKEQDTLSKVLTPSQLLRFNVMREQMAQRIQQLRQGAGMGRGRGSSGGGPGGGPGAGLPGGGDLDPFGLEIPLPG
jgi:Spy/CpxP family protein refolding chaperone